MKKILINLFSFLLITAIALAAFYQLQSDTSTNNDSTVVQPVKKVIPPEERDPNRLWCKAHGLYEDECLICHPELANKQTQATSPDRDPNRLWCNEHSVYEDECFICHPELANKKVPAANQERDPNRLWCNEHSVYEDECLICHPELANQKEEQTSQERDPNRLWCNEHSVYEDECTICHPELENSKKTSMIDSRDPNRLWCKEHNLYEDECTICHPEIIKLMQPEKEMLEAQSQSALAGLFCNEHQLPEIECGICQPELAAKLQPGKGMKIRFASAESSRMAGVRTGKPQMGSALQELGFPCEVRFNQNQVAHISPLADGVIRRVHVELGDTVTEGQLLVEVASNQIAKAKSEYLKAIDQEHLKKLTYEREKNLHEKNITAKQEFEQAEAEYQVAKTETLTARQQLLNYGLTEEDIEQVRTQRSTSSTLKVRAPFDGTVVEKEAVLGESVAAGQAVFELVDLSSMWIDLSIPESHISHVRIGSPMQAEFPSLPDNQIVGNVTWISPQIDAQSRMLKIRAEVDNPNRVLKQGLFGQARLLSGDERHRLLVPNEAVQRVDGNPFVFARQDNDLYELRRVALGSRTNQMVEIVQGLSTEEEIVIDNSFVLKSELLKSRMGAGCVHQ